ncbi:ABC transporter permease [Microlunatus sp. GCM10028923]|uniref:ABC transporter permease n=1 Tax=Microlunatus sp. GCM10028923 TaxID=3273400 RepID=UPI00361000C3
MYGIAGGAPDRTLVGHASLGRFVLIRVGVMGLVTVAVSVLVFALLEAAPGDAATQFLGPRATPERLAALREELGLSRPAWSRYLDWVGGVATGDFGHSLVSGRPVGDLLAAPSYRTAVLAALAFVGVLIIGVGGGVRAGYRAAGKTDRALSAAALLVLSTPEFVVGIFLILVFALWLKAVPAVSLLPSSGQLADRPDILILPAATLAVVAGCYVFRLVRGIVAAAAARPNVEAALLDGIGRIRVLGVHVLPQVIGPMISAVVIIIPYLVGGAVVVEQLFGYPGLGRMLITAVGGRDQPVVMAIVLLLSVVTIIGYALSDVLSRVADPFRRSVS